MGDFGDALWSDMGDKKVEPVDGMDKAAMDYAASIIGDLSQPFDASVIKSRRVTGPQGAKDLAYVDLMTVVDRLNAVCPGWHSTVKDQQVYPFGTTNNGQPRLMLTALVTVYIPGVGSRDHMGVQVVNAETGGEDLWKGAVSDAIKKAASLFGVGRDLYGDDPVPAMAMPSAPSQANYPATPGVRGQQATQREPMVNSTGGATPRQLEWIEAMCYERGMDYAEYTKIVSGIPDRAGASAVIDQLKAMPSTRRLERGQQPPDEWRNEPPF